MQRRNGLHDSHELNQTHLTSHVKTAMGKYCSINWNTKTIKLTQRQTHTQTHNTWKINITTIWVRCSDMTPKLKTNRSRAVVAHAFNPSTQEAEAGGSLWVRDQPGLQELVQGQAPKPQRNPVSKNEKKKKKERKKDFLSTLASRL